jgi:tRNA (cmo5U34)-methyltransferase
MLQLAEWAVGPHIARMDSLEGAIESAPERPFDASTGLLVFHFFRANKALAT